MQNGESKICLNRQIFDTPQLLVLQAKKRAINNKQNINQLI